jgi:glycosyl-4,4'-diaponeurosporenoate acyltransferase
VPTVHLGRAANVLVNVAWWGAVHTGTGYVVHRLALQRLQKDRGILRLTPREVDGRLYRPLRVRRWKDRLPEAGALFSGGMSKRRVPPAADGGLARFAAETRRAELGHWLAMLGGAPAVLWNPPMGAAAMIAYGIGVNAPFVVVQRYNRARAARVLRRAAERSSAGGIAVERPSPSRRSGSSMP